MGGFGLFGRGFDGCGCGGGCGFGGGWGGFGGWGGGWGGCGCERPEACCVTAVRACKIRGGGGWGGWGGDC
jgi:hypothetical protein